MDAHIHSGEELAHAALQSELPICEVCELDPKAFRRGSQPPKNTMASPVNKNDIECHFASPAADFWSALANHLVICIGHRSNRVDNICFPIE